ncbi:MAG: aminoacyl-histidine dipeptidase [Candidatus Aminicenantes bacterium]|nr:aminoacyl-histidine dipeptidase [Candidatus Aminicenantes bacterium]
MSSHLENLKPQLIWKHFQEILKIPRCSGNEKAIGDYIITVAEKNNLESKRDKIGNIVVSKSATSGLENADTVILQGHMDMVCEKNSDVDHDFSKDTIKTEIKDDWVQAQGTTLGADNGIGLAASLAIMEDNSMSHGPLEFLFTVDEETGLTGAQKIEPGFLKGRILLNLDSEEEGAFTIGCAGGADSEITLPVSRKKPDNNNLYTLKVHGLRGGHSGIDIDQGRGNAIKWLARLLWKASREFSLEIASIEGGNMRNAIPRESWAEMSIDESNLDALKSFLDDTFQKIAQEYKAVEKDASYTLKPSEEGIKDVLSPESQKNLIGLLLALPHGVLSIHPEIKNLVETSTNLAIIHLHPDNAKIVCSSRSSVTSALEGARDMIAAAAELSGAEISQPKGYPGWTPNLQSSLLQKMKDIYKKDFGKDPQISAIHAGLECGIIGEKYDGMDMISFGPTIEHPHSPEERVHTGSVEKFWTLVRHVLESLSSP